MMNVLTEFKLFRIWPVYDRSRTEHRHKREAVALHHYHYAHVKECDKKAYRKSMGAGIFLIGAGSVCAAVLCCFADINTALCSLGIGFVIGLLICIYGQYRYNGSIFI